MLSLRKKSYVKFFSKLLKIALIEVLLHLLFSYIYATSTKLMINLLKYKDLKFKYKINIL